MKTPSARRSVKPHHRSASYALALLSAFGFASSSFGQGLLTPLGAPAPTMKSLDQIEARTPISSAPFTINIPGSYYLTKNLSVSGGDAITISADGVTLDLNGFTISSTANPAAGAGIQLTFGRTNIGIRNGTVSGNVTLSGGTYSGSGFNYGIGGPFVFAPSVRVSNVSVSGCMIHGISLGIGSSVVESCTVKTVGSVGISAKSVSSSAADECGTFGIEAVTADNSYGRTVLNGGFGLSATSATNCRGQALGSGTGINAETASNSSGTSETGIGMDANNASNCKGTSNSGFGINAKIAFSSTGSSVSGTGLNASDTVTGCHGFSSSGTGLRASIAFNSSGITNSGSYGLDAIQSATNCSGITSGIGTGLSATNAVNCYGVAGFASGSGFVSRGISATNASNCHGIANGHSAGNGSYGIECSVASFCYARNDSATALNCAIAIGCVGSGSPFVTAGQKYLMP